MFHDESWKLTYFGVRSKVKVTAHEKQCRRGICTLVSAGYFWLYGVVNQGTPLCDQNTVGQKPDAHWQLRLSENKNVDVKAEYTTARS